VRQDPVHHPEGDALNHSLQVFQIACTQTRDPQLRAAALLHDVGKGGGAPDHAILGACLLDGLVSPRVVWLVRHHLDLLRAPGRTRRRLRRRPHALRDLVLLRRWDLAGRDPNARVCSIDAALVSLDPPLRDLAAIRASAPSPHLQEYVD